ncbi:hypothetical protein [Microcoleus sp. F10B5]|uniref:hypothetical protein n=1 Tax=Microcoleus sp. F10B5 TaxID=3055341 RepID=UPI002FD45A9F
MRTEEKQVSYYTDKLIRSMGNQVAVEMISQKIGENGFSAKALKVKDILASNQLI